MSANQSPVRRPKFVTQRDGSPLANSNCRMASISMGLDHHTKGSKTASGGKMRTYTDDQTGGTDSGDAREAWNRGYDQSLIINDGDTFDDALANLRGGRMVHLDIWHASLGTQGCVSGTGAYGHTVAVVPEHKDGKWLVGDPWCTSAGYEWVTESALRKASEDWGRKVIVQTGGDPRPDDPEWRALIAVIGKLLMSQHFPGNEDPDPLPPDTGGPVRILFTTTNRQPLTTSGGATVAGPTFKPTSAAIGKAVVTAGVAIIACSDGEFHDTSMGLVRNVYELVTVTDGKYAGDPAYLVVIPGSEEMGLLLAAGAEYSANPPAAGDVDARDAEWREWLLAGSPGYDT